MRFDGQVAIVTGAASGIGMAIGQRLAAEGAHIVVADVNDAAATAAAAEIVRAGGRADALGADVSNPDDAARMAEMAIGAGGIDVLVNNAGIVRSTRAAEISMAEWDLVMRINTTGAFLCAQAVHPAMRRVVAAEESSTWRRWQVAPRARSVARTTPRRRRPSSA